MTVHNTKARDALEGLRELRRARSRWSKKRLDHLIGDEKDKGRALWVKNESRVGFESFQKLRMREIETKRRVRESFRKASKRERRDIHIAKRSERASRRKRLAERKRRKKRMRKQSRKEKGEDFLIKEGETHDEEVQTKRMFEQDSSILENLIRRQKKRTTKVDHPKKGKGRRNLSRRSKLRNRAGRNILDSLEKDHAPLASHILTFKDWQRSDKMANLGIQTRMPRHESSMESVLSPSSRKRTERLGSARRVTWSRELAMTPEHEPVEAFEPFGMVPLNDELDAHKDFFPVSKMIVATETSSDVEIIQQMRSRLAAMDINRISSPPTVDSRAQRAYGRRMQKPSKRSVIADCFSENPLFKTIRGNGSSAFATVSDVRASAGIRVKDALRGHSGAHAQSKKKMRRKKRGKVHLPPFEESSFPLLPEVKKSQFSENNFLSVSDLVRLEAKRGAMGKRTRSK